MIFASVMPISIMLASVILEDGRRKCPHCDIVQPPNKLGFIRHVAMEHEAVTEDLSREFMDKMTKEKEDTQTEEVINKVLEDDSTEVENKTEASKTQTDDKNNQDGATSDLISEEEKAIMECDPLPENDK